MGGETRAAAWRCQGEAASCVCLSLSLSRAQPMVSSPRPDRLAARTRQSLLVLSSACTRVVPTVVRRRRMLRVKGKWLPKTSRKVRGNIMGLIFWCATSKESFVKARSRELLPDGGEHTREKRRAKAEKWCRRRAARSSLSQLKRGDVT